MADIKITQLPTASALSRSEVVEIVQSGVNKKVAISSVADAPGTAASVMASHEALANPHSQYVLDTDLTTALSGKENTGVAASLIAAHEAAVNPHPIYLTQAEGDAAYAALSHTQAISTVVGLQSALDGKEATGAAASAVSTHVALSDPHTQYVLESELTELTQDTMNSTLVAGSNITLTYNDTAGTITVASTASGGGDAVDSVNGYTGTVVLTNADVGAAATSHTHTSAAVTDFTEAVQDTMNSTLVAGSNITLSYNDASNTLTISAVTGGGSTVSSVNGQTGTVVLTASDVGALKSADIGVSVQAYNSGTVVDPSYVHTDNNFTSAYKTKVDGIEAGAQVNTVLSVNAQTGHVLLNAGSVNAQPLDGDLTAIAALTGTSGLLRKTAADTWSLDTTSYLTGNQTVVLNGDIAGSGTTSINTVLANSGVTAGTYNNSATAIHPFTVDVKGRVTGVGSAVTITPAFSSITSKPTTLSGYGITDAALLTTNTFSGVQTFGAGLKEKAVAVAASNIDCSLGTLFTKTISGATTLTVSNYATSGDVTWIVLELTNGGSSTVTWWSGVKWDGGTAPTLTAAGVDILVFYTRDGGVTWRGGVKKDNK